MKIVKKTFFDTIVCNYLFVKVLNHSCKRTVNFDISTVNFDHFIFVGNYVIRYILFGENLKNEMNDEMKVNE